MLRLGFAILLVPAIALAEPSTDDGVSFAVATNPPLRWLDRSGAAASAYIGFGRHHAIRLNAATFPYWAFMNLYEEDAHHTGRMSDVGIGYQIYPRRLWRGFVAELGVVVRAKQRHVVSDRERDFVSTNIGGRALIGWSWMISTRGFFAASIGLSITRARGTVVNQLDQPPALTSEPFERTEPEPECYVRFGLTFGN